MSGRSPIRRLAVVNRGEAAMRCIRAVKALRALEGEGLEVVALFTESDRDAPFVRHADLALPLASPRGEVAAFLDHEALLEVLRESEADAVWPGWGFVAEQPAFVEKLEEAGIRFLGPPASAMRLLGDKIDAKRLAEQVGVPVTPWNGGALADAAEAVRAAEALGWPVALKASAGGGGRGIRMVAAPEAMEAAFRSASSEARSAFGDDRLFVERRVEGGRHVEVQIAADAQGQVRALGCRDCSVQRRHQKVIEEAPPPGLPEGLEEALCEAAVRVASHIGYEGVGTVEFLVQGERFHFLEMNPRLQVEHGITESITGLDLVQLQIRIARGEAIAGLEVQERGHAIEARVCAEDPDAGFLPSPGRIARFDPALGPRLRIDTGVAAGSSVPEAFDSLVAKVIATGASREEARARLVAALVDFDLVIQGGASNKGWLVEVLSSPEFRAGGVDTGWLDRRGAAGTAPRPFAGPALVAAAIVSYQRSRAAARLNVFADTSHLGMSRVPPSQGQEIDLTCGGEAYRLAVYAMGGWRYRVHEGGRVVAATLREESPHTARLLMGRRSYRVLYDVTETGIRLELEGCVHRFGSSSAGQVRAAAPAMVVSIDVAPGDVVRAGQPLGVLEAMKMEVGIEAPLAGSVAEVRVRKGEQVAAGDVLLVIDPAASDEDAEPQQAERIALEEQPDPLETLFHGEAGVRLGEPDLTGAERAPAARRRAAIQAVGEEVRRVLLGYDANPERADRLAAFLEARLPEGLSQDFLSELASVRRELVRFADVARLFIRAPQASVSGGHGPSNQARLRMYVRRLRAAGAGLDEEYLALVRRALSHYGVASLEPSDALERAVLRLLASQLQPELRDRLVLAMLTRITALVRRGLDLGEDRELDVALEQVASMRGLVSHAVADAAIEARYVIFERPEIEALAERTSKEMQLWLDAAEAEPTAPPEAVAHDLAAAPVSVFERVGRWLADEDLRRRAIALAAHLRRLYAPLEPEGQATLRDAQGGWSERLELPGGRLVLGAAASPADAADAARSLVQTAAGARESHEWPAAHALELLVPVADTREAARVVDATEAVLEAGLPASRFTLTIVREGLSTDHITWWPTPEAVRRDRDLLGLHPEAAARIDLERLRHFELERLPAASEGLYAFHGRSRDVEGDERIFVLADLRPRSPDDGREAELHLPAFEHAFYEATRTLRNVLADRDPKRILQWNRIAIHVAPALFLDPEVAARLARRLAPATRNLGLEKVVVRMRLLDREAPQRSGREVEIVISDLTGSNMTIDWREPRRAPLQPSSAYERRVVEARRRRLVYPYEIVRMLTGQGRGPGAEAGAGIPTGRFEEFDLDPEAEAPRARSVSGRPYGANTSSVVFGIVETPTRKVPEGMRRVLLLSDPTRGMGSLARPECERVVAALDLAEAEGVPLEWVPVSSGARIAMDSGTENLDATARVVRRIIDFTQAGGVIHIIVTGVNVGAQSYWNALATMLMHTRGALIMTPGASMVLTGRAALEASGGVAAEDEQGIGGYERVMGPNGEAQYFAADLAEAYRILYEHYAFTYVVPGEGRPRRLVSADPPGRRVGDHPCDTEGFSRLGEIFDAETNPGRKRPFAMRSLMEAVVDADGGHLERWRGWVGAETTIVWDAHLGGWPACVIGIESRNLAREGYRPADGPATWTGGTLFPLSSKKLARALNAASGSRPAVVLANLSGFDGSPESMRKLQLEYGAEIARAVVNFRGPLLFLVVSRYHGGAYVVFSRALHPRLRAAALEGSYASVIGGGPAAAVVFGREVRARAADDPRVRELRARAHESDEARGLYERVRAEVLLEKQAELAAEFDAIHSVERALAVGSLEALVSPLRMRSWLIERLDEEMTGPKPPSGLP